MGAIKSTIDVNLDRLQRLRKKLLLEALVATFPAG
jgi:hypothetical protein